MLRAVNASRKAPSRQNVKDPAVVRNKGDCGGERTMKASSDGSLGKRFTSRPVLCSWLNSKYRETDDFLAIEEGSCEHGRMEVQISSYKRRCSIMSPIYQVRGS